MSKDSFLEKDEITKRLTEEMLHRREALRLKQREVAELIVKSEKTYQRLESTGKGISDIFEILKIFQVLHFSTTEIINVLGLPPLTLSEIAELYQDGETLKSIRENGICSSIRQMCGEMEINTIERLILILMKEYFKKKGTTM